MAGVELTADRFEIAGEGNIMIAQGNVRAAKGSTVIEAEKVVVWPQEQEMYAEGNVFITERGVVSRTERAIYNWKDQRALAVNVGLHRIRPNRTVNWHLKSPVMEQRGEGTFRARKSVATSCSFTTPHQHFTARKVVFRDDHSIVFYHAVYHIHKLPVFYMPYYYRDFVHDWPWVHFGFGNSSVFGAFFLTDVGFNIRPSIDLILDLDHLSDRGPAGGVDLVYENERRIGYLDTYFIQDEGEDFAGVPLIEEDRYRIKFRHRELLTDTSVASLFENGEGRFAGRWTADLEYQQFSDMNFYTEFFEIESKTLKEPENRIFVRGHWDNASVSALGQARVNEFISLTQSEQRGSSLFPAQTEYLPRLSFDLLSQPFWQDRLLFTFGSEYSRARRRFDDDANLTGADRLADFREISRLDFQGELSAPFSASILHVEPFAFGRETFFEELLNTTQDDWRTVYGAGVRLSTEFWRTFDVVKPKWGINKFHHVVTPEITFTSVQEPDKKPEDLIFFDDVDTEQAVKKVTLNLRNVVQTKVGASTTNWLEFEVLTDFFLERDRDNNGKSWSDVETDLRWRPHPKVSLYNDNEFNTHLRVFETVNAGITLIPLSQYSVSASQRYSRATSNRTLFSASAQMTPKWGMSLSSDYEWRAREFFDIQVLARRTMHCWQLEFGLDIDQGKDDKTFFFFISPKAGGEYLRGGGLGSAAFFGDQDVVY